MNQQNVVMQFNQEEAMKAGGSEYLSEGGAYNITLDAAKLISAKTGSKGLEFSGVTKDGQKVSFLSCYYEKANGEKISGGSSIIQAIMGFLRIPAITHFQSGNDFFCQEFKGKTVGLFLQKKLYTKNDGTDSYRFEIRLPFDPNTNATVKESFSDSPVKTVQRMAENYKDIDERNQNANQGAQPQTNQFGGFPEPEPYKSNATQNSMNQTQSPPVKSYDDVSF